MSRPSEGVRLYFREQRVRKNGAVEPGVWIIRDGERQRSTRCTRHQVAEANRKLEAYLAEKHNPRGGTGDPASKRIADALNVYAEDVTENIPDLQRRREAAARLKNLAAFFKTTLIVELTPDKCKEYLKWRKAKVAARRDLEDLRAATRHFAAQGHCTITPMIWLPEKNRARKDWLQIKQAARLLRAAWRMRQTYGKDGDDTDRRIGRHLAHFIVIGLHSGTRRTVTGTAALERVPGLPYFDLDDGIFYRTPENARPTKKNKNQGPQRVPPHLLAHLRRWQGMGHRFAVEWRGLPTKKINKAFRHACELAGLGPEIVPHTLRHTCVTWMLKNGISTHLTADYVGMSEEMVRTVYGHHCPEHQKIAANHRNTARLQRLAAKEAAELAREFQSARQKRITAIAA